MIVGTLQIAAGCATEIRADVASGGMPDRRRSRRPGGPAPSGATCVEKSVTVVQLGVAPHLRSPHDHRAPATDGRRSAAAARRRDREKEIIAATRALFDERGVREAQIEDIANAVGINRAIVYRHFSGKEELFALTLVGYLDELHEAAARRPTTPTRTPTARLEPAGRRVRRLRPGPPGVHRLRAGADAPPRPRAARRDLRERAVPARPRHLRLPRRARRPPSRPASTPATSASRTRPCSPTRSTPAASAPSSSPGSASWSPSPRPASRPSARSPRPGPRLPRRLRAGARRPLTPSRRYCRQ